ncbi:MAG: type II secretion system F family protein [Syntrophaceae bacterium]
MMLSYCALRKDGSMVNAKGQFDGVRDLMDALLSQEMTLVSYRPSKLLFLNRLKPFIQPKIKRMEIVEFCDSLASMTGSGLPLLDSMESIKETIRVSRLREAIEEVIREIGRGESLSGAFSHQPGVFPEMLVFFCSVGEETGTIQDALSNTSDYLRKVDNIVSQVKRALIYPSFVIAAMSSVIIFWLFFVLPRLVETFKEINVQLPDITISLVHFVEFSTRNWFLFPISIGGLAAVMFAMGRFRRTRLLLNRIAFSIPVVGDLLKCSTLTLMFSNMSLMLHSGVTLTRSLDVLGEIFHNELIRNVIVTIREETSMGNSLLEAFRKTCFFDAITLKMISVGEKTGALDQRLRYLADAYQEKTTRFVDVMGKMIEPVAMAMSGGVFIFVIISLIGPVYDLVSKLGG